jgi:serine protease Do
MARQLGVPASMRGVVVVGVQPGSAAAEAGLQRGDVIQEVNRQPVTSVNEFERAVAQAGAKSVLLLVSRHGQSFYMTIDGP